MVDRETTLLLKEIIVRLNNIERRDKEMHAKIMTGEAMALKPGSEEIKRAAREMVNGNMSLVKALGNRKMVSQ